MNRNLLGSAGSLLIRWRTESSSSANEEQTDDPQEETPNPEWHWEQALIDAYYDYRPPD